MLAKTIKYKDFNDVEREETFLFNLTESELLELEMSTTGGIEQLVKKIIEARNSPELLKLFKKLVFMAYGEKSPDGRRFIKTEELAVAFSQTEAYNKFFLELTSDANAAAGFLNGIIPESLRANAVAVKGN